MRFSQRRGLKPVKETIQFESMDIELKNGLWNVLTFFYLEKIRGVIISDRTYMYRLFKNIWIFYFKDTLDAMDISGNIIIKKIKEYYYNCPWYEVYDFIEFVANNYPEQPLNTRFMETCNIVLEKELSAYRFVGGLITEITSEEEIAEIEECIDNTLSKKNINIHLKRALELLSDRESPDYRNSIKESISSVEATCSLINSERTASLGQALKKLEEKIELHPALKSAFSSLYGYTSDAEGIRHALMEEPNLSFEDAKFMLVSCSAFINYLLTKASKAGINL